MTKKLSDSWETPDWLFDELNAEFNFSIDLCATAENSKCKLFYEDYLLNKLSDNWYWSLAGYNNSESRYSKIETAFMNPPYSNPKPFIEKAWEDSKYCKIVCLVKCDPSTRWWSTFWDYENDNFNCKYCGVFVTKGIGINKNPDPLNLCKQCGKHYLYRTKRGTKPGCEVRFFPKRIKFTPPKGWEGKQSGPTFSSALLIFDGRGL